MNLNRHIYRTEIPISDITVRKIRGYKCSLHVAASRVNPETHIEVWYEMYDIEEEHEIRFRVYGTGHRLNHDPLSTPYIGTVLTHGGHLVWHVYAEYPLSENLS